MNPPSVRDNVGSDRKGSGSRSRFRSTSPLRTMPMGPGPRLTARIRPRLLLGGALAVAAVPRRHLAAQDSDSPGETPAESCLEIETFPVPAGEHPHDVAPAADGQR